MNNAEARQIAQAILSQLGGGRFIAMTGARNLYFGEDGGLSFRIPKSRGITHVRICLNANDLYDVTFSAIQRLDRKVKAHHENVFVEDLRRLFTDTTGLAVSL